MPTQRFRGFADVIIVGGGIAGLSAAYHVARHGNVRVRVLERETLLCSHSSSRNAAMFRHVEKAEAPCWLASRSRALLDTLLGSREGWLKRTGAVFVARRASALSPLVRNATDPQVRSRLLQGAELVRAVPVLDGSDVCAGLFVEADGVIDIHGVTAALASQARRLGAVIQPGTCVREVQVDRGRVRGVRLESGVAISADAVVIAAGAWSSRLAMACGADLPLWPMRRHLVQLEESTACRGDDMPIVWRVDDDEVYARPESGGVLASPCDEDLFEPCLPPPHDESLLLLAEKLQRLAPPRLAVASVRRHWACLRTFAVDRSSVVGADPRVPGLFWLTGLGGHGMTTALAEGELLAAALRHEPHPLEVALSPRRLLRGGFELRAAIQ